MSSNSKENGKITKQEISMEEGIRVLNNLSKIINQRVLAGDKYATELLLEAMKEEVKEAVKDAAKEAKKS